MTSDDNTIMVRIEHEVNGVYRILFGELSEAKLEHFFSREENFIALMNNNDLIWLAKDSIMKISELRIEDVLYEKSRFFDRNNCENVRCADY
jgi:hypothetical protein